MSSVGFKCLSEEWGLRGRGIDGMERNGRRNEGRGFEKEHIGGMEGFEEDHLIRDCYLFQRSSPIPFEFRFGMSSRHGNGDNF